MIREKSWLTELRRGLTLAMCLLLVLLAPACQLGYSTDFPLLPTGQAMPSGSQASGETTQNANVSQQSLRLALPVGDKALPLLRLLYLAKKSGLLKQESGQYIGQRIDLEELQQFDSGLKLHLETVPLASGATREQLTAWQAAANMPDIVYCQNAAASVGLSAFRNLASYLYSNRLMAASHIYASVLDSVRVGDAIYGVPYLASTPLIIMNQTMLSQFTVSQPITNWSWVDWRNLISQIQQAIRKSGLAADQQLLASLAADPENLAIALGKAEFVLEDPSELLTYLPASLSLDAGWAAWNGTAFDYAGANFSRAALWLQQALPDGSSLLLLDAAQKKTAFPNQTISQSARILMRIGDSTELSAWQEQKTFQVTAYLMPAGPTEPAANAADVSKTDLLLSQRLPLKVRSLLVSQHCRDVALAADLAAFLALDADALLMQCRYQTFDGLVPVVRDNLVWQTMVYGQRNGQVLALLQARMPQAYCSGQQLFSRWDSIIKAAIGQSGPQLLTASDPTAFAVMLAQLIAAAQNAREG